IMSHGRAILSHVRWRRFAGRHKMQTCWDILQAARREILRDADGTRVEIRLLPPLSQDELAQLERELAKTLPADIHDLLVVCRGFEFSPVGTVDFSGRGMSVAITVIWLHSLK